MRQYGAQHSRIEPPQQQVVNVRPYQKVHLMQPGSCPPARPNIEDIAYEQKYGKGPLMQQQAERLRRLQEATRKVQAHQPEKQPETAVQIQLDKLK